MILKCTGGVKMIIKLIGMAMVVVSSTLIGFGFAECMASRERELSNLADAVDLMLGELSYTAMPVINLVQQAAPRVNGFAGEMFDNMCKLINDGESAQEAWVSAINSKASQMSLKKEDADMLINSSYLFEAYEIDEQKKCFTQLKERLTSLASDASEYKKKNSKIARMLGLYGGILLCVIIF